MDTKLLIAEAKARFNLNSAKAQLKDKYEGRLILADQGGLWKADKETITFLNSFDCEFLVMIDTFGTPVAVNRTSLLTQLTEKYHVVMTEWLKEYHSIERMR
jgi:hypothetical protein